MNATGNCEAPASLPVVLDIQATLTRMQDQNEKFRVQWRTWAASQPPTNMCEVHHFSRLVDPERSIRDSWVEGRMLMRYCPCPACAAVTLALQRSQWMLRAGVPELLVLASFVNYQRKHPDDENIVKSCQDFARKGRGFLILRGSYGTGKSHLAVAVMRAMGCGIFITQGTLLKKLRDTYRDDKAEDIVEKCKTAKLLVLDEIGLSTGGRDELPALHEILGERHNMRKPTVLTSNAKTTDEFYSYIGERMADRLKQSGYKQLVFTGTTNRPEYRQPYLDD